MSLIVHDVPEIATVHDFAIPTKVTVTALAAAPGRVMVADPTEIMVRFTVLEELAATWT